jgi:hypothetical protein
MDIRHEEPVQTLAESDRGPWPEDSLARVPYWVYRDEPNYQREMSRMFGGATWNFVCLEAATSSTSSSASITPGATTSPAPCAASPSRRASTARMA